MHLPFEAGSFRMAMGLTAVAEADWLEADDAVPAQIATRVALIARDPDAVIAALPGTEAMQHELLEMLAAHLRLPWPACDRDPLAIVGGLVAEDFCLLRASEDGPVLVAAVLCFPARWRLAEKLGRPLAAVHAPVPFYGERLAGPVDRFLDRLQPGRIAVRLNWSVVDDPALFQPAPGPAKTGITAANAGERLFLRVERQSFRRLPRTNTIAFGIRTHVSPLARVRDAGAAARLNDAVRAMPDDMLAYKGIAPFRATLLGYLA
ncbi:heme-dependent oxidative N-demethylase family protein [Lichenicoccus sp.]|uniref:heme-dependent oxidative N-demethylase family protein n=1 Tax=Lichenicoccus sp. TaxID=2781899 RepID=UPI003D1440A7